MVNLDNQAIYNTVDKSGMAQQIQSLPAQCREAWTQSLRFKLPSDYADIDKVLILGMGGSAIGGDLLRALASGLKRPMVLVNRDYDLPAWVDDKTLVIAASYSGNTEETLSAFNAALATKCKKLVVSTGGSISAIAAQHKIPIFVIEHVSQPRSALGYSLMPLLAIMQNLGFSGGKMTDMEQMASMLEGLSRKWGTDSPTRDNAAKQLALKLDGRLAIIYGAGILSDVARRWKTQINENSKSFAFFEILPELNHNAVTGYHYPESLKDKILVVLLRCSSLHPRTLFRYQVTGELLAQNNIAHEFVESEGTDDLARMMSSVLLGDWVSYYLAILNNADPTPVPEIDLLKKRLAIQ